MTKITIDGATQAKLAGDNPVAIYSEEGLILGMYYPRVPRAGVKSPISDAELEELRKQRIGSSLDEVLKRIGAI
ncbi:MAG TPA: hypothetical protein VGJ15_09070 [Pirellulales bacterium]